jgi:hypothetical protein
MGKGDKKKKPAKVNKKQKPKSGPATVNAPRMKQESAPAAVGHDFQTFFKETRKQIRGKDGKLKDAICVEGREYLGPVTVGSEEDPGSVYQEVYLAPGELGGTRLSLYAQLYEKFLFELMDFEYIPAQGSETPGQLVIAHDRDISDPTPPASQQGVRQFLSMEDSVAGNVWMKHVARCPLRSNEDGFFCNPVVGGDDRLSYQGQTYVACVVPSGEAQNTVLGTLLIHYRCCFFVPQLENELAAATTVNVDSATVATSAAPGTAYDLLAQVRPALSTVSGLQSYLPVLQGDGTYASRIPEGIYNYLLNVTGGVPASTGAGVGDARLNYPSLTLLEPNAAPAPQADMTLLTYSGTDSSTYTTSDIPADAASSDAIVPPMQNWLLNVPRGGALLRHTMNGVLASGTTKTWASPTVQMLLTRLGGYLSDIGALIPQPSPDQVKLAKRCGVDARGGLWKFKWRVQKMIESGSASSDILILGVSLGLKLSPPVGLQKCLFCGLENPGHFGRDCPKKVCTICGKVAPGHNRDDCPEAKAAPPAGTLGCVSSKLVV